MKRETYDALLKALQKLEKALVKEGVAAARSDDALKDKLLTLHRESETGGSLDDFTEVVARRSAVQFLLRTVYVRVLEDLGLLEEPRIRGDRGFHAFREVAPALGVRAYWKWVFRDLAEDFPALFMSREEELPLPSEDLCKQVWELWRAQDGKGNLVYDWSDREFESRFLGDLYQDLDAEVRDRYALLQTPDFVEAYILDHTLTPALKELDPAALREKGEAFRVLDPTCGSGHFLIGAFHRMAAYWEAQGLGAWEAAERALESVWGCDINGYAVDVARFRLVLEVLKRTGARDLGRLGKLVMNLRALDSLVPWEGRAGQGAQGELFAGGDRLASYASEREREENRRFLRRDFHVVVGNPPYVTPKDPQKRDDYRVFWPESATGKYGLAAPFVERCFALGASGAFMGQITGNAFAKREFGVSLIEKVLPRWDLTDIIDTSGAYIPGHGTPTVILFGRSRAPIGEKIRCLGGKRGEPNAPAVPAEGRVWKAIIAAGWDPNDVSKFITVSRCSRLMFGRHPWNLNGGGAPELQHRIQEAARYVLAQVAHDIGVGAVTLEDSLFTASYRYLESRSVARCQIWRFGIGEDVRDYSQSSTHCLFPYDPETYEATSCDRGHPILRLLWCWREPLRRRIFFGKTQEKRGLRWTAYGFLAVEKLKKKESIVFAFVSTHNHFVLDRGGKVFKQTAPVIKLPAAATLEDHLDLLGLLNGSTLGFWMKQACFDKGNGGIGGGISNEEWERRSEFDSTKLQKTPITAADRAPRIALAAALDQAARDRAACLPAAVLASSDWTPADLPDRLAAARDRYRDLTHRMVALQEELDWLTYGSYGLLQGHQTLGPAGVEPLAPGHRPFEILLARHNAACDPDERSAWFERHGHDETTTIPERYSQPTRDRITERLRIIASNPDIRLIEQPQFKRRWQLADLPAETRTAATDWLLDRLEDLFAPAEDDRPAGPLVQPRPYRLEEIVAAWSTGPQGARVLAVAKVLSGTADLDLAQLAERLLRDNAIPDNPFRVYTSDGVAKLRKWQHVWALQDREDAGEKVKIPEPPEFSRDDFTSPRYFQIRGKLNVPRERFVRFADLSPPAYGWNGWRDRDRAMAQVDAYARAEQHPTEPLPAPTAADPRRCGATVGLWESLPDLRRWGDPATREGEYGELLALAREACHQQQCPCDIAQAWQKWTQGKLRIGGAAEDPAAPAPVTGDERDRLTRSLILFGKDGATLADLDPHWFGAPKRLAQVLDELIASGDVAGKGRGKARRYRLTRP